jgi:hypothetical protein
LTQINARRTIRVRASGMSIGLIRARPALPAPTRAAAPIPIFVLALGGFASGSGARLLDPLLPQIADSFGVTVAAASAVIAAFVLPYGLGQVILGPLGDRWASCGSSRSPSRCTARSSWPAPPRPD